MSPIALHSHNLWRSILLKPLGASSQHPVVSSALASSHCPNMAPKAKKPLAVEDEISRLQARTLKLQYKSIMQEVLDMLKAHPELLPSTLQHMKNIHGVRSAGMAKPELPCSLVDEDSEFIDEAPKKKAKLTGTPMQSPSASTDASSSASVVTRADIPKCYTKVSSLPPVYLSHVITALEPIALSKNAMRAICNRGQKIPSKLKLLEIFELLTTMGPDDDFPPVLHKIPVLIRSAKAFNESRGRPGRELQLPPIWLNAGVYKIIMPSEGSQGDAAQLSVQHMSLNITKVVPSVFDAGGDPREIYVEKNFSENRAQLVNPTTCSRLPLQSIFPEVIQNQFKVVGCEVEADGLDQGGSGEPRGSAELEGSQVALTEAVDFAEQEEAVEEEVLDLPPGVPPRAPCSAIGCR